MLLSGWGILLIFSADQGFSQTIAPFPPFGLVTLTSLVLAAYLMLVGIYNSAALVSVNEKLRTLIRKTALESRLLGSIGQAEMENEIENKVKGITKRKAVSDEQSLPIELDEQALRRYIDYVVKEVKEKKD
jgi:hypothetical protein